MTLFGADEAKSVFQTGALSPSACEIYLGDHAYYPIDC